MWGAAGRWGTIQSRLQYPEPRQNLAQASPVCDPEQHVWLCVLEGRKGQGFVQGALREKTERCVAKTSLLSLLLVVRPWSCKVPLSQSSVSTFYYHIHGFLLAPSGPHFLPSGEVSDGGSLGDSIGCHSWVCVFSLRPVWCPLRVSVERLYLFVLVA